MQRNRSHNWIIFFNHLHVMIYDFFCPAPSAIPLTFDNLCTVWSILQCLQNDYKYSAMLLTWKTLSKMLQFSKINKWVPSVTAFFQSEHGKVLISISKDQASMKQSMFWRRIVVNVIVWFPAIITSNRKPVAAGSQLLTIFQNNCHTLAQALDPSLVLVQVSYWWNMHRRLRLRRRDSGA